jgi:hypothetical protein
MPFNNDIIGDQTVWLLSRQVILLIAHFALDSNWKKKDGYVMDKETIFGHFEDQEEKERQFDGF